MASPACSKSRKFVTWFFVSEFDDISASMQIPMPASQKKGSVSRQPCQGRNPMSVPAMSEKPSRGQVGDFTTLQACPCPTLILWPHFGRRTWDHPRPESWAKIGVTSGHQWFAAQEQSPKSSPKNGHDSDSEKGSFFKKKSPFLGPKTFPF